MRIPIIGSIFAAAERHAEEIVCSGAAVFAAASDGKKLPTFSILAYTGGALDQGWLPYPIVVDLAGMEIPRTFPVLADHDTRERVGHSAECDNDGKRLQLSGIASATGKAAQEVVQDGLNGFPWQASIRAAVLRREEVDAGTEVTVNGRKFTGPLFIARQSRLKEVSFVALGADDQTEAKVAASAFRFGKESDMKFEQWLKAKGLDAAKLTAEEVSAQRLVYEAEVKAGTVTPPAAATPAPAAPAVDVQASIQAHRDAMAAEEARIGAVRKACGSDHAEIAAQAIKEGWDEQRTRQAVELADLRASRPQAPFVQSGSVSGGVTPQHIEAALAVAGGLQSVERRFPAQVLDQAQAAFPRGITIGELLLMAAHQNGYRGASIRGHEREVLRAAFSTMGLSGILSNTANKFLLEGFMGVDQTWRRITSVRPVKDFKTITSYRMSGGFEFEEVGPDGELKHGELSEDTFTNQAKTYGKMFAITRTDIINDDLGALSAVPRRIGRGAALKLNTVFWTAFLDNSTFFTTGYKNYSTGAGTALASAGLKAADQLFLDQTDKDGNPLGITPKLLLVPTALKVTAAELMTSTQVNTGGSSTTDKVPNKNIWAGLYEPLCTPYLSNSGITGYSSTAWYLLADPRDLPVIETVFLNGVENPTVETADADFEVLGIQHRGYFDFGVAKQEYRGGVKMRGT